jgi:hypothetical protein
VSGGTVTHRQPPRPVLLVAFLGGFVAWLLDLVVSYALVPVACDQGAAWSLHLASALFAGLAAGALVVSVRERRAFLARAGVGLNALALGVIALMWLLLLFLDPCAGGEEFPLWVSPS